MAFREYKIGAVMFGVALSMSMFITLVAPSFNIISVGSTALALDKELTYGFNSGFSFSDPLLTGGAAPRKVTLKNDPVSGAGMEPVTAYVFLPNMPFPSGILHPAVLGEGTDDLSVEQGRINEASEDQGAVFLVQHGAYNGAEYPYIENATATRGWSPDAVLTAVGDANVSHAGSGKVIFVREGCWWCHTLLPEQTQDFQYFGAPPYLGDFNGESPTAFGSDRKAPDLLHVGARNSSKEWMMMHFFNPRLVQPHSIMPRFDYLWGKVDANGNEIDYNAWRKEYLKYRRGERVAPPEVPVPAPDSEARYLIDFVLNLK
ncbi:MAG: cbb3-type cytochrome c oxidase subunit II [Gammaproteobacteria bacterium]|nr:cbb3-type cytochrome c oxidase subunit II [Gammaproteobacteria bacterium]